MKRKIKLLFIAISICAMLFTFAISSSAWSLQPHEYDEYAYLCTDNDETVAYVWYKSGNELCVSVDFSKDLKNIRSYTLTNNFGRMNDYSNEQIFTFIEEYIASVKPSLCPSAHVSVHHQIDNPSAAKSVTSVPSAFVTFADIFTVSPVSGVKEPTVTATV